MKRIKQWKTKINPLLVSLLLASVPISTLMASPAYAAAGTYYKWTGADSSTAGLNSCTSNCWSVAGNWDISTDGGSTYATATQAPQSSDNSGAGDNLVFDVTPLGSPTDGFLTNDLSNLQVGNIEFTGTNNLYQYGIGGNAISLGGGITDSTSHPNNVSLSITLTANQTFSSDKAGFKIGVSSTLDVGAYNLNVAGNVATGGAVDIYSVISGTGALVFSGAGEPNFIDSNNPNFSGSVTVSSGTLIINASNTNQLGTGAVTVASGATLQESINNNGTYTVANPLTVSGNGFGSTGALIVHGYSATGTVNFTGPITLAGDTQVGLTSGNADFSGTVNGCGYSLSKTSGSNGTLSGNLTGSCAADPGGGSSSGGSGSSGSGNNSPKTPDTGYGVPTSSNPLVSILIIGAIVSTGAGLLMLYRQRTEN